MPNFNQAIQPNLVAPVPMPVVTPSPALAPSPMPQIGLPSGDYNTNPYGGNSVPTSDVPGNNNNDPAKVPNLQSNMFKMQRNKSKINFVCSAIKRSPMLTFSVFFIFLQL